MKVTVTPECVHPRTPEREPFYSHGDPIVGRSIAINPTGIYIDDKLAFRRVTRRSRLDVTPHRWEDVVRTAQERVSIRWTHIRVEVQ